MRFSALATALAFANAAVAHPGMDKTLADIRARAGTDPGDSTELIGDLITTPDNKLTPVGKSVKNIITGNENPQSTDSYFLGLVPPMNSDACRRDTCCIWKYVSKEMEGVFRGPAGRCTNLARGSVRLGFHDAGAWSKNTGPGGADGSIVLLDAEANRRDNLGLAETIAQYKVWYNKYKGYGVGMADLIQMGANVATVVCPLGPRVRSYVGRKDNPLLPPEGLLPSPFDPADKLIQMFEDKTIGPHGLVALVGAHTSSQQRFVDPARAGDPQDSTPGVWDVKFYSQTLGNAPPRVFKFQSDIALSQHPETKDEFAAFAGPGGQPHWNEDYAREYVRLSLLGVNNINGLTECTKVLPQVVTSFRNPDQSAIDKWLSSIKNIPDVANDMLNGKSIGGLLSKLLSLLGGK